MLDYVGLPFDPSCLQFHANKRAVHTPSAEQVRQPINRDGTEYWRHYQQWLGPLEQAARPGPRTLGELKRRATPADTARRAC